MPIRPVVERHPGGWDHSLAALGRESARMLSCAESARRPVYIRYRRGMASCHCHLAVKSDQREEDMKSRPFLKFALHFDLPSVLLNDAVHNGKAEAGSVILGGKEWVEDVREVL